MSLFVLFLLKKCLQLKYLFKIFLFPQGQDQQQERAGSGLPAEAERWRHRHPLHPRQQRKLQRCKFTRHSRSSLKVNFDNYPQFLLHEYLRG